MADENWIDRLADAIERANIERAETNRRLNRLEELAKRQPAETGRKVADEVNRAAATGQRRTETDRDAAQFRRLYERRERIFGGAMSRQSELALAELMRDHEIEQANQRYQAEVKRINGE